MAGRRLAPEDESLWARLAASVTPLIGRPSATESAPPIPVPPRERPRSIAPAPLPPGKSRAAIAPADTLDGGWDRRLRRGSIAPDRTIDLHGHTLASARDELERALADAVADEARVLLVITGRPPRGGDTRRGLIRASIGDWLGHSAQAARIAAVRVAHPRHGGAGALYLILRRRRG